MNIIKKTDRYIARSILADMIGSNKTYLCVLAKQKEVTPEMDKRIKMAIRQIIKQLEKLI